MMERREERLRIKIFDLKKNAAISRQCVIRKKCRVILIAGMMLAELFAVPPIQARGAAFEPYAQEGSVSDNDMSDLSEEVQEQTSEETTSKESQDRSSAQQESQDGSSAPQEQTLPIITAQPEDVCVEAGDCAYFNVSAVGENLTYQWFVDKGNGSGFQKIMGAEDSLYRVMVFDGAMNGYLYKCRVREKTGNGQENGTGETEKRTDEKDYTETRAAILTVVYRIVGGARSVWVKSSGRGLVFQGSGAYSKFSGVSVDGSRITAGEYNKGGSQTPFTEITLLRSYLETLAEGEHELEIVWEDSSAKTSFHIEAPASELPAGASGLGRPGDEEAPGSSRAAGTTSAAGDAAAVMTGGEKEGGPGMEDGIAEKAEKEPGRISENTTDASVSENTVTASSGTAADVLEKAGILADLQEDKLTVTRGERRTESLPSDFKKNPVRFAAMSEKINRYARSVCMAVIVISVVGIAVGFLAYRLHDVEGNER